MIRSFDGQVPEVADSARVDETAVVIGDVTIGEEASIWPNVTLRGDNGHIDVGAGTNIQDNAVCHEPTEIGPDVTVGHTAIVHAATVEERATIGMGAVVLDDAHVGHHSIVAAGSVVTEGTEVPANTLVAGSGSRPRTTTANSLAGTTKPQNASTATRNGRLSGAGPSRPNRPQSLPRRVNKYHTHLVRSTGVTSLDGGTTCRATTVAPSTLHFSGLTGTDRAK